MHQEIIYSVCIRLDKQYLLTTLHYLRYNIGDQRKDSHYNKRKVQERRAKLQDTALQNRSTILSQFISQQLVYNSNSDTQV